MKEDADKADEHLDIITTSGGESSKEEPWLQALRKPETMLKIHACLSYINQPCNEWTMVQDLKTELAGCKVIGIALNEIWKASQLVSDDAVRVVAGAMTQYMTDNGGGLPDDLKELCCNTHNILLRNNCVHFQPRNQDLIKDQDELEFLLCFRASLVSEILTNHTDFVSACIREMFNLHAEVLALEVDAHITDRESWQRTWKWFAVNTKGSEDEVDKHV